MDDRFAECGAATLAGLIPWRRPVFQFGFARDAAFSSVAVCYQRGQQQAITSSVMMAAVEGDEALVWAGAVATRKTSNPAIQLSPLGRCPGHCGHRSGSRRTSSPSVAAPLYLPSDTDEPKGSRGARTQALRTAPRASVGRQGPASCGDSMGEEGKGPSPLPPPLPPRGGADGGGG